MADEVLATPLLRFGVFEMDLRTGELRKSGKRVRLAPQPFKLLVMLARKPGELVTREEIQQEIWGDNTVVDYEQGLSFLVKKVRAALGDHSDSPRYIETLPRRGYRFIAPVEALAPGTEKREAAASAGSAGGHSLWLMGAGLAATVALLVALNVGGLRDRIFGKFPPHIQSIAVLPVENLSGDPEQEYFADGMTDELITKLSQISSLQVISRWSTMVYKGSKKPIREIARELNVDAVMEASVLRSGDRVHVNVELVEGSTGRVLRAQSYERDSGDVLFLTSDVARAIVRQIRITVKPEELERLASARPVNPEAYEAYLRGRHFLSERTGEDTRKGLGYFDRAVEIDPSYAPAYAGTADAYVQLAYYGPISPATANAKARKAALKAIALDDSLAEAHNSLAEVHFHYDWDWSGAEREYRRAIALNPGYAKAHHGYSVFLDAMGRHDEALSEIKTAQKLSPLSLIINTAVGLPLFYRGDYDLAIKQWQSTLDLNPNFWVLRLWLGLGYLAKGLHDEALGEFELAVELSKENPSALAQFGYGYAVTGKPAKARQILDRLRQKAKKGYVSPYQFAVVYAALGEKDQAIKYLEEAFRDHYTLLILLNQSQVFPSLHSDSRYQNLLRQMNFPP